MRLVPTCILRAMQECIRSRESAVCESSSGTGYRRQGDRAHVPDRTLSSHDAPQPRVARYTRRSGPAGVPFVHCSPLGESEIDRTKGTGAMLLPVTLPGTVSSFCSAPLRYATHPSSVSRNQKTLPSHRSAHGKTRKAEDTRPTNPTSAIHLRVICIALRHRDDDER